MFFFSPLPSPIHMNFVVFPPGVGRSVEFATVFGSVYICAGGHCLLSDLCIIYSEFGELILLPKLRTNHF